MALLWTAWAAGAAFTIIVCAAAALLAAGKVDFGKLAASVVAGIASIATIAEAGIAQHRATAEASVSLRMEQSTVTALIFREGYEYDDEQGNRQDKEPGWYMRIGGDLPKNLQTAVAEFPAEGKNVAYQEYPDTPGVKIRNSMSGFGDAPLQICTGNCEGIETIADGRILGADGIVIADWERVQSAKIGQPALGAEMVADDAAASFAKLSAGRWAASASLGGAAAAAIIFLMKGALFLAGKRTRRKEKLPPLKIGNAR